MSTDKPNGTDKKDGPVLDPEELDISELDEVAELGEDRFLISASGPAKEVPRPEPEPSASAASATPTAAAEAGVDQPQVDAKAVSKWLAESMADNGFAYGFDATLKFDGSVVRHRMVSNDVVTTFETLMLWYARQVGGDTPVEETLGILLAESEMPIQYPTKSLKGMLNKYDLSTDDSIADLVDAVNDAGGLSLSTE